MSTTRTVPNNDDRATGLVKYGLGDATQEESAEGPEASCSENNEVDVAAARDVHDLPRGVSIRHEALAATTRIVEQRSRISEDSLGFRLLAACVLITLPVVRRRGRSARLRDGRARKDVEKSYAAVPLDLRHRKKTNCGA